MSYQFNLSSTLFKGVLIICCQWVIHDNHVRQEYHQVVGEAIDDVLQYIENGTITLEVGAQKAHQIRNHFFNKIRKNTSPIGLLVAHSIHSTTRPYQYYVEKNAQSMFGMAFKDLSSKQTKGTLLHTIRGAKRPSRAVTWISQKANYICQAIIITVTATFLFAAATSKSRDIELIKLFTLGLTLGAIGRFRIGINMLITKRQKTQKALEKKNLL